MRRSPCLEGCQPRFLSICRMRMVSYFVCILIINIFSLSFCLDLVISSEEEDGEVSDGDGGSCVGEMEDVSQCLFGEEDEGEEDEGEEDEGEEDEEEVGGDDIGGEEKEDDVMEEANQLIRKELGSGGKGRGRTAPSGPAPAKKRSRYSQVYTPQL